ncbi:MAG: glycosyltransferase family 4 protein [Alphaproteobacteria bacterium]|nr:glycosyltransferase family 4 protein [Alphaproteobacteria bacterium]
MDQGNAVLKILFALSGLHRVDRGAEVALIAVANALARSGDEVTLIGAGDDRPDAPYKFLRTSCIRREAFEGMPSFPILRNEYCYEELTFLPGLLRRYRPADYDVTVTCGYPFTNWALRWSRFSKASPPHVFVTQNGDWPARAGNAEYRFFGCDGLICTNPDFYDANKDEWRCALIPNGVDTARFWPGPAERGRFALPEESPIVLMVSALIPSKRVDIGVEAVSHLPDCHLVVAGDGPMGHQLDDAAARLMPGRFTRLTLAPDDMPALYRSADVFLHLSTEEAFGNVFVEAMACGLPIVGHDTSRLRWVVGESEFLGDTGEAGAVASLLTRALQASGDRTAPQQARVADLDWANIASKYRAFLQTVVDARSVETGSVDLDEPDATPEPGRRERAH